MDIADGRTGEGWSFSPEIESSKIGGKAPSVAPFEEEFKELARKGKHFQLHRVYTAADPHCTTRVTVPVLWDKQERTIVNNESSEIIKMFNEHCHSLGGKYPERNIFPNALHQQIEAMNARLYNKFNNGVYRSGFSGSDEAYHSARKDVFDMLDEMEDMLGKTRFLLGEQVTYVDLRAFPTLVRFDIAYHKAFGCNLRMIREEYPNISDYLRELCSMPGWRQTMNQEAYLAYFQVAAGRHWPQDQPLPKVEEYLPFFDVGGGRRQLVARL